MNDDKNDDNGSIINVLNMVTSSPAVTIDHIGYITNTGMNQ